MNLTVQLTPDQIAELAAAVAAQLSASALSPRGAEALTLAEAAKLLNVSPATLRRRIAAGTIPSIPNLGRARIPAAAVRKMLEGGAA